MPKTLLKGESQSIQVRFPNGFTVSGSPTWTLYDWNNDELLAGTAVQDASNLWSAQITVPRAIVIPGGEQELYIDFVATSTGGKQINMRRTMAVIDAADNWQEFGLIYYVGKPTLKDLVFFSDMPKKITTALVEGYDFSGDLVRTVATSITDTTNLEPAPPPSLIRGTGEATDPDYTSITSLGYAFNTSTTIYTANPILDQSAGLYPFQLITVAEFDSSDPVELMKPVYVSTPTVRTKLVSLRRLLDKARLVDIDKNLQWHDDELIHFLMEGMHYVNSYGETTYWRLQKMPASMYDTVNKAAAWAALNARFLAEGLNAFEMQGVNVQLNFNRSGVIQTKMDELKGVVDAQLQSSKPSAIREVGKGIPPPGAMAQAGMTTIGALGIEYGPMVNVRRAYPGFRGAYLPRWTY